MEQADFAYAVAMGHEPRWLELALVAVPCRHQITNYHVVCVHGSLSGFNLDLF